MRYIFILAVTMFCLSCNKYLEVEPADKFLDDQVFSNKYSIEAALNGIYLNVVKENLYGGNLSTTVVDAMAQYYNTSNATHKLNAITSFTYTNVSSQTIYANTWSAAYTAILNLNIFSQKLASVNLPSLPENEKNIMLGEAKALKAMIGFDMLRLFGPVYKVDSLSKAVPYPSVIGSEVAPTLTAVAVMDSVLADLGKALNLLDNDPVKREGVINPATATSGNFYLGRNRRMNYYAVLALTARANLYRGNKGLALYYSERLINEATKWFPWSAPAANPSAPDRVFSSELLFGPDNIDLYNMHKSWLAAVNVTSSSLLIPFYDATAGADRLAEVYERQDNDYRYKLWWDMDITSTLGVKTCFKFVEPSTLNNAFRYMQPLIRISEMYLIAAETTQDAARQRYYLNQLQFNRGIQNLPDGFDATAEIEKAYKKEFWGEGQLFFFYKRINKTTIKSGTSNTANQTMNAAKYVVPMPLTETQFR